MVQQKEKVSVRRGRLCWRKVKMKGVRVEEEWGVKGGRRSCGSKRKVVWVQEKCEGKEGKW